MSNREKVLWTVFTGILILLYLLSSTDLIIKEEEKEIRTISVIVPDANDEYYANFRKGMDNAAEKLHADVKFITLYEANNMEEQMELFHREMKDGADAIILEPVNEKEFFSRLKGISTSCPVILLGSAIEDSAVRATVTVNKERAGECLAENLMEEMGEDTNVLIITEGLNFSGNDAVFAGVERIFEKYGCSYCLVDYQDENSMHQVLEDEYHWKEQKMAILALDAASLSEAARRYEETPEYQKRIDGIYGIDSTISILRSVDRGVIDGIMVYNQYDAGYISVSSAVESITKGSFAEMNQLESYYINKENLRDPKYEKLLYPIE